MPIGFEPVYDRNSEILILGSFPSVKSRDEAFYYGNPQNRFWRLLGEIYGAEIGGSAAEKTAFLLKRRLALWDVVVSCDIVGSLDANIKNPVIADVSSLVAKTNVRKILLNGNKSFELFTRFFPHLVPIASKLPSTSPANVRFDKSKWVDALRP